MFPACTCARGSFKLSLHNLILQRIILKLHQWMNTINDRTHAFIHSNSSKRFHGLTFFFFLFFFPISLLIPIFNCAIVVFEKSFAPISDSGEDLGAFWRGPGDLYLRHKKKTFPPKSLSDCRPAALFSLPTKTFEEIVRDELLDTVQARIGSASVCL